MKDAVKAFKSLSDQTRLRVLNLILQRECCVCEVMQALGISQSKASRHLSALYDAGFLKQRKDGLWSLYSMDREGMPDYLNYVTVGLEKAFAGNPAMAEDIKRLAQAIRVGPRCAERGSACKAPTTVDIDGAAQ